jgi:hypothetical protein
VRLYTRNGYNFADRFPRIIGKFAPWLSRDAGGGISHACTERLFATVASI